jgi:hypothetical protein
VSRLKRMPLESEEELRMIKRYLLLPVLMDVLESDMRTLAKAGLKMPAPYLRSLRAVQQAACKEEVMLRRHFRAKGIRVYRQRRTQTGIEAEYLCRGYQRHMRLLWSNVRSDTEALIYRYLGLDPQGGERQ